jgi:hypothetical protein
MNLGVPIFLAPLTSVLEKEFMIWKLKETRDHGREVYITFEGSIFSDTHLKIARKIAKNHGFRLGGFGVRVTGCNTLLVTFVLKPKRR